ncbi:uncharacterized protein LOC106508230 [Sus scrofa]|uniref:uncharacterized protein LOC106508230 n=1 Tax=Sus scrofa TaxID=9823 RepID=UPI000A2B39EA|nr:uncharacterized protein LOC106508230 [Sus scrofa]
MRPGRGRGRGRARRLSRGGATAAAAAPVPAAAAAPPSSPGSREPATLRGAHPRACASSPQGEGRGRGSRGSLLCPVSRAHCAGAPRPAPSGLGLSIPRGDIHCVVTLATLLSTCAFEADAAVSPHPHPRHRVAGSTNAVLLHAGQMAGFFALPGSLTQPTTDHLSRTPVDVLPNLGPSKLCWSQVRRITATHFSSDIIHSSRGNGMERQERPSPSSALLFSSGLKGLDDVLLTLKGRLLC